MNVEDGGDGVSSRNEDHQSRDDNGSGRDLPKTGADRIFQGILAAIVVFALGGLMLTVRRKSRS